MVMHSLPLKSFPRFFGKGRGAGHGRTEPFSEKLSSLFWERGGGHGHTEPSSETLSSPFWEREVVVVMVIHS